AVQRSLEKLASKGTISEKINGKQRVYAPKQEQFGDYNEYEVKAIDEKIHLFQERLKKLQQILQTKESELRSVSSTLTTKDAKDKLTELTNKATEILNGILEGYPKPKKQLIEDIGIETDEEYGTVIPNL
ncbi:Homologous-pairing protein 2-like protein, partial [Acropora cervicornis]